MKLSMFTTKESYVAWLENEIEAIRKNGLKAAKEQYELALEGVGKESWMRFNKTSDEAVWEQHLNWLKGLVEYLEKKIKKYQKEIAATT